MSDWIQKLQELGQQYKPVIMITVINTRGSAPREAGAKMLVSDNDCQGTIGGGELERVAIEEARQLLAEFNPQVHQCFSKRFALGPNLGQCCGGTSTLMFEAIDASIAPWVDQLLKYKQSQIPVALITQMKSREKLLVTADTLNQYDNFNTELRQLIRETLDRGDAIYQSNYGEEWLIEAIKPSEFKIVLFGAGHVGKAVVNVLSGLPCEIIWVDSRENEFPVTNPDNVRLEIHQAPEYFIDEAPVNSYFLIMTHSHPLDQEICERILKRNDFAYCGLIGSLSKRRKFEKRLKLKGIREQTLKTLTCPIGIDGISGKRPYEIAISVAAQLLQHRESQLSAKNTNSLSSLSQGRGN